jgi:acyl dehydratase
MASLYYEDFQVGQEYLTRRRTVTEADITIFAGLSGDHSPIHTDEMFAKETPFGARIAQGALGLSIATGLIVQMGLTEETAIALLEITCKFTDAIRIGDTLQVRQVVDDKRETSMPGRGIVTIRYDVLNQHGKVALTGLEKLMIKKRS